MPFFGYRITINRSDGSRWPVLREFEAPDSKTARQWVDGWLAIEGHDESDADVLLIADGVTLREHMVGELVKVGHRMQRRFPVVMDGPVSRQEGAETVAQTRLWLPNGRGVSLASELREGAAYVDTEMFPVRREPADRYGWVPDGAGVMEYSARIDLDNDAEVSGTLAKLAVIK